MPVRDVWLVYTSNWDRLRWGHMNVIKEMISKDCLWIMSSEPGLEGQLSKWSKEEQVMTGIQAFLIGLVSLDGYFSLFESEDPRWGLYYQSDSNVGYISALFLVCGIRDVTYKWPLKLLSTFFVKVVYNCSTFLNMSTLCSKNQGCLSAQEPA